MSKRFFGLCAAIAMTAGLLGAAPARAQSPLGFSIDPTLGIPGITVHGQVDTDDVAQFCVTDINEFQARFGALFEGPFVQGNTEGELPQRFFADPSNIIYETPEQVAYVLTLFAVLGIAQDIGGATQAAFPQTFVITFADIATQEPIGELGSFDPSTGVGSVTVPNLPPGIGAVAAVCAGPSMDIDTIEAGVRESGAFLESIGIKFGPDGPTSPEFEKFARKFLKSQLEGFELLIAFVQAVGPTLIQNFIEFDALGLAIFTVQSVDEALAGFTDAVNGLVQSGALKQGHGRGLLNRLRAVRRSASKTPPRLDAACRQLGNLIDAIERLVSRGQLSPTDAATLIDEVQAAMSSFGCAAPAPPL